MQRSFDARTKKIQRTFVLFIVDNRMLCFMPTAAALASSSGAVAHRACPSGVSDDDDDYPEAAAAATSTTLSDGGGSGSDYVVVTQDGLRAHTVCSRAPFSYLSICRVALLCIRIAFVRLP